MLGHYKNYLKSKTMENKETVYLWVLDYNDKATYKYAVALRENPNDYRKMLRDVGHDLAKIEWMLSPYYEAINASNDMRVDDVCRPNTSTDR